MKAGPNEMPTVLESILARLENANATVGDCNRGLSAHLTRIFGPYPVEASTAPEDGPNGQFEYIDQLLLRLEYQLAETQQHVQRVCTI